MMLLCPNCKIPTPKEYTEDGRCDKCGLLMLIDIPRYRSNVEFDLMLTALLYGKKP